MERYQFTRDKDSQITNDPNDWSDDPQYIINLVKRIVRVIPGKGNRNDYNNRYRET